MVSYKGGWLAQDNSVMETHAMLAAPKMPMRMASGFFLTTGGAIRAV